MNINRIILAIIIAATTHTAIPLRAQTQRGKASFYSKRATGARTSSGERIHHDSLTCAHRTYPFGTLLKVTNERNGKEVVVRVTDRGPHTRGRIIDLSHAAARRLGIIDQGVAMVRVQRYHDTNIPYRPEPDDIPEMDFEVTEYTLPASGTLHFPTHGKQYRQYVKTVDDNGKSDSSAVKKNAATKRKTAANNKKHSTKKKGTSTKKKTKKRRR